MAETTEQTVDTSQNGLLDFNWDDSTESFFGLDDQGDEIKSEEKPKVTITPTEVVEDEKSKNETPDEAKPKEEEKTIFFEEGEEDEKSKGEGAENPNFYTDVYKDLKESGIFKHVEIDEDEELDADRLYELQQEEIETEVGARLQSWANEDLDEDAQAFIKFKLEGGEEDEKSKGEGAENPNFYTDVYKDLKESGIFKHVEIDEDEELDADRLYELQQEEIETEVGARLQSWANEDLDEDAQAFIKFKLEGGDTSEFFKIYQNSSEFTLGDIEDEDYQDNLIRYQLKKEGWDKDEIEDRLEYLTETDKKAKFAEKYHDRLEKELKQEKQILQEQLERQKQQAKQQEEEFKNNIKDILTTNTTIRGLKISEKDKNTIFNFLTKKDQKVDGNVTVTGFQRKLSEVFKDPNKIVLLAKIVNDDFDFSSIEKSSVTKKTKEVKRNIENRQSMRPSGSGSSSGANSLASLFDK